MEVSHHDLPSLLVLQRSCSALRMGIVQPNPLTEWRKIYGRFGPQVSASGFGDERAKFEGFRKLFRRSEGADSEDTRIVVPFSA